MKRYIAIALLCFLGSVLYSQINPVNLKIKWTPMDKSFDGMQRIYDIKPLMTEGKYAYFWYQRGALAGNFSRYGAAEYILKYDTEKNSMTYLFVDEALDNKKKKISDIVALDNEIYVFSEFENKPDMEYEFYVQSVDKSQMELENDVRKIANISLDKSSKTSYGDFSIISSPNKKYHLAKYSKRDKNGLLVAPCVMLFDSKLDLLWGKEDYIPKSTYSNDKKISNYLGQHVVDNEGNIYFFTAQIDDKELVRAINLSHYATADEDLVVETLKIDAKHQILNYEMATNDKNEVVVCGVYSNNNTKSACGIFNTVYSRGLVNKETQLSDFSDEFLTKGMDKREGELLLKKKNTGKEFDGHYGYSFKPVHFRKDGGFVVTAEKSFRVRESNSKAPDVFKLMNEDIMLFSFDTEGALEWSKKIPSTRSVANFDLIYGSYFVDYDEEDNIRVIYEVNEGYSRKNLQPLYFKFDKSGKEIWHEIFSKKEEKGIRDEFVPKFTTAIGNNKYVFFRVDGSKMFKSAKFCMGLVELPD